MLIGRVPSIFCDDCANYDTYSTPSHCNTCKELSGATYTLNQIIPAKALKITKGDDLGKYTYKGDSGSYNLHHLLPTSLLTLVIYNQYRKGRPLLLLQELH